MSLIIESLRTDLNRNRSYVRSTREAVKKGREIKSTTRMHLDICNHDAAVIKKALKDLRKVKIVYQWLKPESKDV